MKKEYLSYGLIVFMFIFTGFFYFYTKDTDENTKEKNDIKTAAVAEKINEVEEYKSLEDIPLEYSIDDAFKDGCVEIKRDVIYNEKKLTSFLQNYTDGVEDVIRIASWTKEGDLILTDIVFKDQKITLFNDSRRDEYGSTRDISMNIFDSLEIKETPDKECIGVYKEIVLKKDGEEDGWSAARWFVENDIKV